jgi:hypothetical protein
VRAAPPTARAAVAAAATPVVAAALLAVAVIAWACEPGPPDGRPSPPTAGPIATPAAAVPSGPPRTPWPPGWRLVVVVDPTVEPRAVAVRPDPGGGQGGIATEVGLPQGAPALAALAVAADGAVAAVAPDGRAWTLSGSGDLFVAEPPWRDLGPIDSPAGLPGPVLGATWSATSDALLALSGAPGSGHRRTVVVAAGLDGAAPTVVEIPLEADGPGLAALPDGQVAFVVRDLRDRGALARLAPAGSFVTLPVAARGVAAGGDVFAIVDDAGVRVGSLEELRGGTLPIDRLPLEGSGGSGAVAIAGDGSLVAVVRLDDDGAPDRIEVLARDGSSWIAAGAVPFDDEPGSAIVAWVRAP